MDFVKVEEGIIEILPCGLPVRKVLEEIARLSYETASSPLPQFILPFEIEASGINFAELVSDDGLSVDFLNGRLCSTFVEVKNSRLFFDAGRFKEDRGATEPFLQLLKERLEAGDEAPR
jgi:hypothetical protein